MYKLFISKESFETVKLLNNNEKGQVLTALCEYADTNKVPDNLPLVVQICFYALKNDLEKVN